MKITKEEILNILIKNGFGKEQANEILEMFAKGLGHSIIDFVELIVSKTENKIDDAVFSMLKNYMTEALDNIDITI